MAKKSGVYIGPEMESAIGPLTTSTVSARINRIGDRPAVRGHGHKGDKG